MRAIDRRVGIAIVILAVAVLWTARSFPNVPGQTLGASTLPLIIAAGLLACGLLLVLRGVRPPRHDAGTGAQVRGEERLAPAIGILAAIAVYLVASEPVGYLPVAPVTLLVALRSLRVRWAPAIGWAILATLAVHVVFYKLLKVPLPWGVVPVLY